MVRPVRAVTAREKKPNADAQFRRLHGAAAFGCTLRLVRQEEQHTSELRRRNKTARQITVEPEQAPDTLVNPYANYCMSAEDGAVDREERRDGKARIRGG